MRNADLIQKVEEYLRTQHIATLATAAADGPWAAAVFYVSDGRTLYFLSSPNSRHCRNLERDARAAATIQGDYWDWEQIKGVQLEGRVSLLTGQEEERSRLLYAKKFPFMQKFGQAPAAIAAALTRVRWYSLVPARLFFIDNSVSFGHRDEVML